MKERRSSRAATSVVVSFTGILAAGWATAGTTTGTSVKIVAAADRERLPTRASIVAKPLTVPGPDRSFEIDPKAGDAHLPLAEGTWMLAAEVGGFWCDEQIVAIGTGAGEGKGATLTAWPTGALSGTLARDVASEAKALHVGFEPTEQSTRGPRGTVRCSTEPKGWKCVLPAGRLDVQFNVEGRSTDYRWGVSIAQGRASDLGELRLVRGASVVGWIENPPAPPLAATITLRHPDVPAVTVDGEAPRETIMARATDRGFFQVTGLKAADYALRAEAGRAGEAELVVSVQPDRESRLNAPVHLSPLAKLSVAVDPPLDPSGQPWMLQVDRIGTTALQGLTRETLPATGTWKRDLSRGDYLLSLGRTDGTRWTSQLARLSDDTEVTLEVGSLGVTGEVRLGDEPLAATLVFGANTEEKVQFTSGPDGSFSGALPRGGRWTVDISSATPAIHRTVRGVDVTLGDDGDGRVKILLDDTVVKGVVVDGQGRAASGIVAASPREANDPPMSIRTGPDGAFELRGLPEGNASLVARSDRSSSDAVVVRVDSRTPTSGVTLQLKPNRTVRGRVLSADGRPVWNAQVLIAPIPPTSTGVMRTTDADGVFEAEMPEATTAVSTIVSARSFALRVTRLEVQTEQLPVVVLDAQGGTLRIALPGPEAAEGTFLLHEGAVSGLTPLRGWLYRQGLENPPLDTAELSVPQMAAGTYSACTGGRAILVEKVMASGSSSSGRCVSATLVPGGEAVLDLRLQATTKTSAAGN